MKKLTILSAIALSGLIFNTANAQVRVRVGLNLGPVRVVYTQHPVIQEPVYDEPAAVYDDSNDDDYYYLPDVDAYYDVTAGCYYYNDGYNWISAAYLPGSYRNYDWRTARRYEIHEHRPFIHNDIYRSKYNGKEVAEWRNHSNQKPANGNHYGNKNNSGYDQPSNQNHGQSGYGRPNQNNGGRDRGQGQPSNQNNGGSGSHGRGGDEHYAGNSQNMGTSHRMAKF